MRRSLIATAIGALAGVVLTGCATSSRSEREQLRELSLHAYDEGIRFVEAGNDQLALERFHRSAVIRPNSAAYFRMGRIHEKLGEAEEAAVNYLTALQLAPDFQEARFALLSLGYDPPETAALESDPHLIERFSETLLREVELRRIEKARAEGSLTETEREALRQRVQARLDLASRERLPTLGEVRAVLFPSAGTEEALPSATEPTFASEREIILNTYPYHFANGQRYQRNGELEKAAQEYQLALNADPRQIDARLNLGDVMLRLERYPQAYYHYVTALEEFPDSPRPLLKLGNYYNGLARPDLARDFYQRALRMDERYLEALNNLAVMAMSAQDYDEAIRVLERVVQIDSNYALGYLNLGIAHENAGRTDQALRYYRQYVALGGDRAPEVRRWIAEME